MKNIYGYYFAIVMEKGESGYIAYAPGVGGIYEEGRTVNEAKENAYKAACAILGIRLEHNDPITQNNKYLRVITAPPTLRNIDRLREIIPNGYISTPVCAASAYL